MGQPWVRLHSAQTTVIMGPAKGFGKCSCGFLEVEPDLDRLAESVDDERQIVRFAFDGDAALVLVNARLSGRAGSGERVEYNTVRRCYEPHEPAHQVERFDCRVRNTVRAGAFRAWCFRFVAEHRKEP